MTYLLDANVVSYFLQAKRGIDLSAAAGRCKMALVEDVSTELEGDRLRGGAPFRNWLRSSALAVRTIAVGSREHGTLNLLPSATSTKGRGERASIALAAFDASLTFVTHDKNAMWIALRELWKEGERIIGPPVFLRRLFEQKALVDPQVLDDVMSIVGTSHRPSWWADWRSGLAVSPPTAGGGTGVD